MYTRLGVIKTKNKHPKPKQTKLKIINKKDTTKDRKDVGTNNTSIITKNLKSEPIANTSSLKEKLSFIQKKASAKDSLFFGFGISVKKETNNNSNNTSKNISSVSNSNRKANEKGKAENNLAISVLVDKTKDNIHDNSNDKSKKINNKKANMIDHLNDLHRFRIS